MKAFDWLLEYGLAIAAVVLLGLAVYHSTTSGPEDRMPDDFNYSESKQAVESFYGVPCSSISNDTYTDQYRFECSQTRGNYSYVASATVEYNESGPHEVYLYE